MADQQEDQQQQQNMLDALLVPIDDQVKIGLNNFRIALEKSHPDVIYKVCMAILQQYSFFNAFIRTADAPGIYMQQFWHTVHYDLIAKAYFFTIDDQIFDIDQVLENLNFSNKGAKDPVFGMPIPMVMLNDEIKASADYADYLANTKGGKLKGRGKGPVTMKGVEVVVEKIAYVRVPKTKRTYTLTEQSGQSEGVEDDADFKETEEEDEIPLVRRQTRVVIGRQVHQESDEEALAHFKKLKGVERMSEIIEFLLQLKKARKASKDDYILQQRPKGSGEGSGVTLEVPNGLSLKDLNEGFGVILAVPNEPIGSSDNSSSESEDEERFLTTDEENSDADADAEKKSDNAQDGDEHAGEDHTMNEQARIKQSENAQAKKSIHAPQMEQHFINDNPGVSLTDVLKDPVKPEVQSMVDVPVLQGKVCAQRPPLVDTNSKKPKTQVDTSVLDSRATRLEKKVEAMSRFIIPEARDEAKNLY
ncbi:hypothetical protein Tco_0172891 [Tanacetum coccineum]